MKPVLYTLTASGIFVPVEEGATHAEVQQAYDIGFAFGQVHGARQAYADMERAVAERQGLFGVDHEDVETSKRRMLH